MKIILLGCLLGLCGYANGQLMLITQKSAADSMTVYIDSQKVDFPITYLDPNNIKDASYSGNKVYLTWITPHPVFLTLGDISSKRTRYPRSTILYIIDDSLIKDTANVRIDPSYILRVKYDSTADKKYLSPDYRQMGILLIETKKRLRTIDSSTGTTSIGPGRSRAANIAEESNSLSASCLSDAAGPSFYLPANPVKYCRNQKTGGNHILIQRLFGS